MAIATIRRRWEELRKVGAGECQIRVDAEHPHDLYLSFSPPDHPGLLALCVTEPPKGRPFEALRVESRRRDDLRWSFRIELLDRKVADEFAVVCADVVAATRCDVGANELGGAIVRKLERWRHLLERGGGGLEKSRLRGLCAELVVLEELLNAGASPRAAVDAWIGPGGAPQDFALKSGRRLEVKAVGPQARTVEIHGLDQLDTSAGPVDLIAVTLVEGAEESPGATTAAALVMRLTVRLDAEPLAMEKFAAKLSESGWYEHEAHAAWWFLVVGIDTYAIDSEFPTLTRERVPFGIAAVNYSVVLPVTGRREWRAL